MRVDFHNSRHIVTTRCINGYCVPAPRSPLQGTEPARGVFVFVFERFLKVSVVLSEA